MLRCGAARSLSSSLAGRAAALSCQGFTNTPLKVQIYTQSRVLSFGSRQPLSLALHKPASLSLRRYASTGSPIEGADTKLEKQAAKEKLEKHPESVSVASSVRQVFHEEGVPDEEKSEDMMAGIKSDMKTIKETFTLREVPREALYIGMAGVLPYLATSLSTVYLAWDMNHATHTGSGFLLDGKTAELLLHTIEPLQVGYGAVIISFLGAIHWGLEWAKYGGELGYSRYMVGVVAPAIAWPTILLPVEYALIAQFLAFNYLYFVDARASARGAAPPWYSTYRFVLTFIVGASIVASLIGRGQIVEFVGHPSSAAQKIQALREHQSEYLAEEDEVKEKNLTEQGEDEDEE
ncbi:MAG: hypothetical protein MMC23_004160 [Stictis urceolatum]|nr:hypothetical protein [Stictis urceolata]